jgi:hypothetical protein
MGLTARNSRSEDIGIEAVVVAELKFRDVKEHIFFADLMERADNATLHERPEALNRVGMHRANNILPTAWSTTPWAYSLPRWSRAS